MDNPNDNNPEWDEEIEPGTTQTHVGESPYEKTTILDRSTRQGNEVGASSNRNADLVANYQELLRQQAIYYPVCYRFQRELGRGRQGIVFQALRQGGRGCLTKHAIKLFDPGIYSSNAKYWTDMGRIASQLSLMQTMRSPNLVNLDTYDEVNGVGYVQMEVVNGVDLRNLLRGQHLPAVKALSTPDEWEGFSTRIFRTNRDGQTCIQPGIAVHILRMMLRGLESLHEVGFVHSDIKPSNVMVNRLGHVQLIDYGRATKPDEPLQILLGSPMYMAPETHRREPSSIRGDLFSVGMVGLEILRGKPLVEANSITERELLEAKMSLPNRLEELVPDYIHENKEFMEVLRRLTHPDPQERYANAREAETEKEGLRMVHKQLMKVGKDADYSRELGAYMAKLTKLRQN